MGGSRMGLVVALLAAGIGCGADSGSEPGLHTLVGPNGLIDDRVIAIQDASGVDAKRQAIIGYLWGASGLPLARLPAHVETGIPSPVQQLVNLERVDRVTVAFPEMGALLPNAARGYHFIPQMKKNRVLLLHQGHSCTIDGPVEFNDRGDGFPRTLYAFLEAGISVVVLFMPFVNPDDCRTPAGVTHDLMFFHHGGTVALRYFIEPVIVMLNYLQSREMANTHQFPHYVEFDMAGLSGGGWTTTLAAAIDPRIRRSFPVAGSLPLYLRHGVLIEDADAEQRREQFYGIVGYPELYVLGAAERGRQQVQILNRGDTCCYGEMQHDEEAIGLPWEAAVREVEGNVRMALAQIGTGGSFQLEIDESAHNHTISWAAVNIILRNVQPRRRRRRARPFRGPSARARPSRSATASRARSSAE